MVNMQPVNSSNIAEIGHDADANKLHVTFHSGARYVYHDVDAETHSTLINADSVGKHFNSIKNNYEWDKL